MVWYYHLFQNFPQFLVIHTVKGFGIVNKGEIDVFLPGADCGSDHELLITKFRLKLKKVEKTARPFWYDLNQIPYDYTVEVRNRFRDLDLIDRVPDELWTDVRDIVQETGIKTIPMEKKCKKSKMAVWGGLTNSCEKERGKKQRRKGKI